MPLTEPESLPETSSEWSCSWHLFLCGTLEIGGFPADTAGAAVGARNRGAPCLPLETLPSPVIADDMNEEVDETLKLSLANSISVPPLFFEPRMLGFVKSRVRLCFACGGANLAGAGAWIDGDATIGLGVRA